MAIDTHVENLVLNVLTQEEYDAAEKNENEIYLVEGESDDMSASTYDPQGKETDVFAYVDDAVKDKLSQSDLQTATDAALAQAKASGEFDGADGYTPVKGTDYWTDDDKAQMVNDVIAALPDASEVSY